MELKKNIGPNSAASLLQTYNIESTRRIKIYINAGKYKKTCDLAIRIRPQI